MLRDPFVQICNQYFQGEMHKIQNAGGRVERGGILPW